MITHVVAFTWRPEVTDDMVSDLSEALDQLPSEISMILSYDHGRDMGLRDGNADYAIVVRMVGPAELSTYMEHPAHQVVVDKLSRMVAGRSAVQMASAS